MTTLNILQKSMPVTRLNGESSLPPLGKLSLNRRGTVSMLDEDDELFVDYGLTPSYFPYREQDLYDRALHDGELTAVVLENEYLRAEFVPSLGGKLWSLFDKEAGRELLFANPVFRPCNLAARNAWTSGGVEWNCGPRGHHPHTCSPLFTARLSLPDGTPVLRMYQFERLRCAVYQMDFFLPAGSRLLYARMRIVNPNRRTIPMYWWSNIAVPELAGARVVMDTDETYTNRGGKLSKTSVPVTGGIDITYPVNNPTSIDFFWKLPQKARRYVCQIGQDGYGLIQASTQRLKGRKLFVWGQGPGGERWQSFLSGAGNPGRYVEIQAGLACTQYESLPMPPQTAWEWMEVYGALQADPARVHGPWDGARAEVNTRLDALIAESTLETLLRDTRETALQPAQALLFQGGGWGALENLRRAAAGEPSLPAHLDFGAVEAQQESWRRLLEDGFFGEHCPQAVVEAWMEQPEWEALLEQALKGADAYNWYAWLHLGMLRLSQLRLSEAKDALERSMGLTPSPWALYGLAQLARLDGREEDAAMLCLRASLMKPEDVSLAREAARSLCSAKLYGRLAQYARQLPADVAAQPRIRLYLAMSYVNLGRIEEAETLLYADGGIQIPDIREGEISVTELWYAIEEAKAAREGKTFDRESAVPPLFFDFRMSAKKKTGVSG